MNKFHNPARNKEESYEQYCIRRCVSNETVHEKKSGILFYASSNVSQGKTRRPYLKIYNVK